MTRKELKEKKLKEEKKFLESIKGKYLNQNEKSKFRTTSVWKEFRKRFIGKVDPVTLKKLPKRFNLHHMDLCPKNYTDLKANKFVALGNKPHEIIHYLYGYYRYDKDILKRIKKILDLMVEINDGKDICDYRKEVKNGK